jgi:hypothetical protein
MTSTMLTIRVHSSRTARVTSLGAAALLWCAAVVWIIPPIFVADTAVRRSAAARGEVRQSGAQRDDRAKMPVLPQRPHELRRSDDRHAPRVADGGRNDAGVGGSYLDRLAVGTVASSPCIRDCSEPHLRRGAPSPYDATAPPSTL